MKRFCSVCRPNLLHRPDKKLQESRPIWFYHTPLHVAEATITEGVGSNEPSGRTNR